MTAAKDVESRVFLIKSPPEETSERGMGGRIALTIAALFAILFLTLEAVGDTRSITAQILQRYPLWWDDRSEADRAFAAGGGSFELAEAIARRVPPQEKVLTFRQAEIGFYTRSPFVSQYDPAVAPIFLEPTPEAAARALKAEGVHWIALPDYPLPEITNSIIAPLVESARYTELREYYKGYRLYSLLDEPRGNAEAKVIAETTLSPTTSADALWTDGSRLFGVESELRYFTVGSDGRIEARMRPGNFTAGARTIQLRRRYHSSMRLSDEIGPGDFVPEDGLTEISADLEGWGRMEIAVQTFAPGERRPVIQTSIVWTGVLLGDRKTVRGQFLRPERIDGETGSSERAYRIVVRLRGPGELRFGGWRALSVSPVGEDAPPETVQSVHEDRAALVAELEGLGWSAVAEGADGSGADFIALGPENEVVLRRPETGVVRAHGPWLAHNALASMLSERDPWAMAVAMSDEPFFLRSAGEVDAEGAVRVQTTVKCGNGSEIVFPGKYLSPGVDGTAFDERLRAPCLPMLARATFIVGPAPDKAVSADVRIVDHQIHLLRAGSAAPQDVDIFTPARDALFHRLTKSAQQNAQPGGAGLGGDVPASVLSVQKQKGATSNGDEL